MCLCERASGLHVCVIVCVCIFVNYSSINKAAITCVTTNNVIIDR